LNRFDGRIEIENMLEQVVNVTMEGGKTGKSSFKVECKKDGGNLWAMAFYSGSEMFSYL
jgi:hypothetical protein